MLAKQPCAYSSFVSSGMDNPTGATSELRIKYECFFDLENVYKQFQIATEREIFAPDADASLSNVSQVMSVKYYCLPKFVNSDVAGAVTAVLFSVPVLRAGLDTTAGTGEGAAFQQTTVLTPTAISDWVHVGTYSYKSMNANQFVIPGNANNTLQCFGAFGLIDPDTGNLVSEGVSVQCRAVVTIAQTIPNWSFLNGALPIDSTPGLAFEEVLPSDVISIPAMVSVLGTSNIS